MSVNKLLSIVAIAATLCSCHNEQTATTTFVPDTGEIQLNMVYPNGGTRVNDQGFEPTDQIGVYVTASDAILQLAGNEVNNELFTYNGTSWSSQRRVYWNEGLHNLYAYYPYSSDVNDIESYNFDIQIDQSQGNAYSQSDFLWASAYGVAASEEPVKMTFEHTLSKAVVELVKGEKFDGDIPADAEVYIHGTVTNAVIDLSTGGVAKDGRAAVQSIKCKKVANDKYEAIVVPQSLSSKQPLVEIISGNISYLMYGKLTFRPGYKHTLIVTLNQNPDQIEIEIGGSIDGWE